MRSAETRPLRVVSGGQTGVDRGALDAALERGVPCGGWCPAGRLAEDGVIPARYPVTELREDNDGTLIVTFGRATGGTARTIELCEQLARPHLIVDAASVTLEEAVWRAVRFLREEGVGQLNVAGPRASGEPRAYEYAYALVRELCRQCGVSVSRGRRPQPSPE